VYRLENKEEFGKNIRETNQLVMMLQERLCLQNISEFIA
jgi:hypothetical protein